MNDPYNYCKWFMDSFNSLGYYSTACYYGYRNPWMPTLRLHYRYKRQISSQQQQPQQLPYLMPPTGCNPWFMPPPMPYYPPQPQPQPQSEPEPWQPPQVPNQRPWYNNNEPDCPPCECDGGCGDDQQPQYDYSMYPNCDQPCECDYDCGYDDYNYDGKLLKICIDWHHWCPSNCSVHTPFQCIKGYWMPRRIFFNTFWTKRIQCSILNLGKGWIKYYVGGRRKCSWWHTIVGGFFSGKHQYWGGKELLLLLLQVKEGKIQDKKKGTPREKLPSFSFGFISLTLERLDGDGAAEAFFLEFQGEIFCVCLSALASSSSSSSCTRLEK